MVKTISEGSIDPAWIKALEELEKRSRVIDEKSKGPDNILAVTDIKPLLTNLMNKVHIATFSDSGAFMLTKSPRP